MMLPVIHLLDYTKAILIHFIYSAIDLSGGSDLVSFYCTNNAYILGQILPLLFIT